MHMITFVHRSQASWQGNILIKILFFYFFFLLLDVVDRIQNVFPTLSSFVFFWLSLLLFAAFCLYYRVSDPGPGCSSVIPFLSVHFFVPFILSFLYSFTIYCKNLHGKPFPFLTPTNLYIHIIV